MSQFVLGITERSSELKERLLFEMNTLDQSGLPARLNEERVGDATFYCCEVDASGNGARVRSMTDAEEVFRSAIAQAVAQTIIGDFELQFLRSTLKVRKPQYAPDECDEVVTRTRNEIHRLEAVGRSERCEIANRVLHHVNEERLLNFDGFVRFRLRNYMKELTDCLTATINRYESDREYIEFVELLRYFMECQEPSVDELHILPDEYGSFSLVDQSGSVLHDDYLESFVKDLSIDGHVRREDLLISALITLAPTHVHCHLPPEVWNLTTLEKVLSSRMQYCHGCGRCQGFRGH